MNFDDALYYGKIGESLIGNWLRKRGNWVLPVYEKQDDDKKGPRLFLPEGELIAPDMLVLGDTVLWMEAKHKTAFSWHRRTERWVTGIDMDYYQDYLRIHDESPFPVWLMFVQKGGHAKDSPEQSPSGLYGNSLSVLRERISHRSDNYGHGGMIYWAETTLKKFATLEELLWS